MISAITSAMGNAFDIIKTGVTSILNWATTASTTGSDAVIGGEWIMLFMFGMPLVLIGLRAIKRIVSTRV